MEATESDTTWEVGLNKRLYYFANISATNNWIFMKFENYAQMIVMNFHNNFSEDLCTHTHVRGKNVRSHIVSHVRAFTPRACVCVPRYLSKFIWYFITII